jgi:hypothetical protein
MTHWEYLTLDITWQHVDPEPTVRWDYVAPGTDDQPRVGLDTILNHYGAHGWELVHLLPITWTQYRTTPTEPWRTIREDYQAVFKRPRGT